MKRILVVEDSGIVTKIIRHVVNQEAGIEAIYAASFAEAKLVCERLQESLFAALVDLNLPDAPDGEVVDFMLAQGVPTIVLTASFDEQRREALLTKGIVDYVTKEGRYSYHYALNLIKRLDKNQHIKVLVVDDSETSRSYITELLRRQLFQILEATNGVEAIKVLLDNPEIKLLITDYNMPQMDGVELVKNLRYKYEKSELVIIGLSAEGHGALSAKFIKNGANDFLHKPFCQEEFNCRVQHNVEALELIEKIRDVANRDHLTQSYNRGCFFRQGEEIYHQAQSRGTPLAAAVLDIDHFKRINDSRGHGVGDRVLQAVARTLNESLGRFLVARAGGGEFFVLLPGLDNEKAMALIDKVRQIVASTPIEVGEERLYTTFSAGVTNRMLGNLDEQINEADDYLYRAKEAGRNLVVGDDDDEGA